MRNKSERHESETAICLSSDQTGTSFIVGGAQ